MSFSRPLRAAAVLGATLLLAAACGADESPSASTADGERTVLRLQDPGNAGILAYAKREGLLEEALEAVGASVEWGGSYASFTATIDAVHAGSVNVLGGATSPVIGYLATSDDVKIVSVAERPADAEAPDGDGLVVPPDSDIESVQDLEGRRVAVNRGGRGEYLLLLALREAGIPFDAVERVYLNPDEAASAFATGQVDAWWAIVRAYPQALASGARVIVNSRELPDGDLTIYAARTDLLESNPEAVAVFLEVVQDLTAEANAEPERFQNIFETQGPTATSGDQLALDIASDRFATVPRAVTDEDVAKIQEVADFFAEAELVPERLDAADAVYQLDAAATP